MCHSRSLSSTCSVHWWRRSDFLVLFLSSPPCSIEGKINIYNFCFAPRRRRRRRHRLHDILQSVSYPLLAMLFLFWFFFSPPFFLQISDFCGRRTCEAYFRNYRGQKEVESLGSSSSGKLRSIVLFESVSWSADSRNKNSLRSPGKSAVEDWIIQKVEES